MDHRARVSARVSDALRSHGVGGIFIDPEGSIISSANQLKDSPRRGTAFYHTHLRDEVFETVATSLAEGVGVSTTARIHGVDKKTVLLVLTKAATHVAKVNQSLLRNLVVSECQLDEMWSFIGKKEKNLDAIEKLGGVLGDAWIWVAFDAVNKVFLATVIGKRTESHAVALLEEVKRVTARIPTLFSSDQLAQYTSALLQVYGRKILPARKPGPGRRSGQRHQAPRSLFVAFLSSSQSSFLLAHQRRDVPAKSVGEGDPTRC